MSHTVWHVKRQIGIYASETVQCRQVVRPFSDARLVDYLVRDVISCCMTSSHYNLRLLAFSGELVWKRLSFTSCNVLEGIPFCLQDRWRWRVLYCMLCLSYCRLPFTSAVVFIGCEPKELPCAWLHLIEGRVFCPIFIHRRSSLVVVCIRVCR